jgi:pimeloyl-ACP methyl ester carboxylesterase
MHPNPNVVLVHGAWADGSSWSRVITELQQGGTAVIAAPIPLTSLDDDVNAVIRTIERTEGPVVLAGHAYAGGVIGATRHPRIQALVNVAALAPDEGETVADVFYRTAPHPQAPELKPDDGGWIWLPDNAFPNAFAEPPSRPRATDHPATGRHRDPPGGRPQPMTSAALRQRGRQSSGLPETTVAPHFRSHHSTVTRAKNAHTGMGSLPTMLV